MNSLDIDSDDAIFALTLGGGSLESVTQSEINQNLRVTFFEGYTNIDAVYCTDLYAKEIAEEKNGTRSTKYYTGLFTRDDQIWICPDTRMIAVRRQQVRSGFNVAVYYCETSQPLYKSSYAGDETCEQLADSQDFVTDKMIYVDSKIA